MSRPPQRKSGSGAGRSGGERSLGVRVKTAKGRKTSSKRWLERQLNDPYVQAARREGYRSRAAYKLLEIDDKYRFLTPGSVVIDLGAAPGGWSQVAAARVCTGKAPGFVLGLDLLEIDPLPDVTLLQADFMDDEMLALINGILAGRKTDVVLSDMAAAATGHKQTDHIRIISLCEAALEFAEDVMAPGGTFLAKVLQGGTEKSLLDKLKRGFENVRHVKPEASRSDSAELYVLAQGFRGIESERNDK
jgi:23S rRNA (uridine2552-2'-O)-methyltransferase